MNIRVLICLLLSVSILGSVQRPNILLIVVDDLKPKPVLGAYGDHAAFTPNLDRLAARSTIFNNAFAQQAVCGPSRTSFLTSRRPDRTRLYDFGSYWRNHHNYTTIPQYFKENGYETYSMGKIFHPGICSNHSDDQPYSWTGDPYHPPTQDYMNAAVCPGADGRLHKNVVCPVTVEDQPGGSLPDIQTAGHAVSFLNNRTDSGPPFLLAVGFHKPHLPLKFPVEYLNFHPLHSVHLPNQRTKPPGLPDVAWNPWRRFREREDIAAANPPWPFGPLDDQTAKLVKQGYYAAVSYIDNEIGKVLAACNFENTAIVLTADHGWSLGEHGEWAKFSLFEEATRVPLIVSLPSKDNFERIESEQLGAEAESCQNSVNSVCLPHFKLKYAVPSGERNDDLVELVDLFPSLVDIANLPLFHYSNNTLPSIPVHSSIIPSIPPCYNSEDLVCTEGKSFAHLLQPNGKKPEESKVEASYSQYPRPSIYPSYDSDRPAAKHIKYMGYSLRTQEYRCNLWTGFSAYPVPTPHWNNIVAKELYLHATDAGENNNVADNKEHQDTMETCAQLLRNYSMPYI